MSQFIILVCITLVSLFVVSLFGVLILSMITGIGLKEISDIQNLDFSRPGAIDVIRGLQVVQFIGLFLVPVLVCTRLFSSDGQSYLGLKKPFHPAYYIAGIGVMLLAIPLGNLVGEFNRNIPFPQGIENWMKEAEDQAQKVTRELLTRHTLKDLVINVVCIAGLAAVGEELLFRGMAQRLLIKMFKSPWAGIIVSAILFSAMHLQFYGFLVRLALGILLGAIYWYSGSLWAAILAHFFYDALLIVLAYFNPEMLSNENPVTTPGVAVAGIFCGTGLVLVMIWMKRRSASTFNTIYADDAIPVKDDPF